MNKQYSLADMLKFCTAAIIVSNVVVVSGEVMWYAKYKLNCRWYVTSGEETTTNKHHYHTTTNNNNKTMIVKTNQLNSFIAKK